MLTLTYAACKYPFLLMVLFAVPLIIAMPEVLHLWLKEVPEYTVVFCRLLLLASMFNQISMGLTIAAEATGKVKLLHSIIGTLHIVSLPAGYLFFKFGYPPQTIMWCIVTEEVVASVLRLILVKRMIDINVPLFLKNVVLRSFSVVFFYSVICGFVWNSLPDSLLHLLLFCAISAIVFFLTTGTCGLTLKERQKIKELIQVGLTRIKAVHS